MKKILFTLIFLFLLYDSSTGIIFYSIKDSQYDLFHHTTNTELSEYHIDETTNNKDICNDLLRYGNETIIDINGNQKYYISSGALYERENWTEYIDPYF